VDIHIGALFRGHPNKTLPLPRPARYLAAMNTTNHAVIRELLNPDTPLDQIAERHDLPIPDLLAILESDAFHAAADALARAESIRTAALAPVRRERALRSLTALASQEPTSATHAESVRRAATAILKETRREAAEQPARPATPRPPQIPATSELSRHAADPSHAGGADAVALVQALASPEMAAHLDAMFAHLEHAESRLRALTGASSNPCEPAPPADAA
jgi:hypothetical protein